MNRLKQIETLGIYRAQTERQIRRQKDTLGALILRLAKINAEMERLSQPGQECGGCEGEGQYEMGCMLCNGKDPHCPECSGSDSVMESCQKCGGSGRLAGNG